MAYSMADLFSGGGGTSTGALEALATLGMDADLTAINHWEVAVATHRLNHPHARHLCASLDALNPRDLFDKNKLDLLWASPECTHHSVALGKAPINEQSRATAWCVVRWADALQPPVILIENVPTFATWGPVDDEGRPISSKRGTIFHAWTGALESLGYRLESRLLIAADYGDPTTRQRLFIQAVLGDRAIVWPEPTHSQNGSGGLRPWVMASDCIRWDINGRSIYRRRPRLSHNTLRRIEVGQRKFGRQPFLVKYFGSATAVSIDEPFDTFCCKDKFGLVRQGGAEPTLRMLTPDEQAAGQGFRPGYRFAGNRGQIVAQIGNAVPRRLARAMVLAAVGQRSNIADLVRAA